MKKFLTKLLLTLVAPGIVLSTVGCRQIDVYSKVVNELKTHFKDNGWTMAKQPDGFFTLVRGTGEKINVNFHGGRASSSKVNLTNWGDTVAGQKVVTAVNDELLSSLAVNGAWYTNGPSSTTGILDSLFQNFSGKFYGKYVKQVFVNPTENGKTAFSGLSDLNYVKFLRYENNWLTLNSNLFLLSASGGNIFITSCKGTPPVKSDFTISHVYLTYSLYANTNAKGEVVIPFKNLPIQISWLGPNP